MLHGHVLAWGLHPIDTRPGGGPAGSGYRPVVAVARDPGPRPLARGVRAFGVVRPVASRPRHTHRVRERRAGGTGAHHCRMAHVDPGNRRLGRHHGRRLGHGGAPRGSPRGGGSPPPRGAVGEGRRSGGTRRPHRVPHRSLDVRDRAGAPRDAPALLGRWARDRRRGPRAGHRLPLGGRGSSDREQGRAEHGLCPGEPSPGPRPAGASRGRVVRRRGLDRTRRWSPWRGSWGSVGWPWPSACCSSREPRSR